MRSLLIKSSSSTQLIQLDVSCNPLPVPFTLNFLCSGGFTVNDPHPFFSLSRQHSQPCTCLLVVITRMCNVVC